MHHALVFMQYLLSQAQQLLVTQDAAIIHSVGCARHFALKFCHVTGIKAVKLYAWERPFERRINHLRWLELEQIR